MEVHLQLTVNDRGAELAVNRLATGPDFREGLDALQAKRPPHFRD